MKIFLSYASQDQRIAEEVRYALMQEGHTVFLGSGGLEPGRGYHRTLRDEVRSSDLFIFLISTHSVAPGRYTLSELGYAKEKWPKPASQVLPVLVASEALRNADPYLTALTVLETKGNVAAETVARVALLGPPPPVGDVLLDEAHGQSTWHLVPPPTSARGYRRAKLLTEELGLRVGVLEDGLKLSDDVLDGFAALVLPIAPQKQACLTQGELAALARPSLPI